jgi:CRISPR-associated protein Cst2
MSLHIFGAIITGHGCAANNRGETEGNITTLQKLLWQGEVHTTVSAEAIRWALRYYWERTDQLVNRQWNDDADNHFWRDSAWEGWAQEGGQTYIDDDLLGFMLAEGAKEEGDESTPKKGGRKKGSTNKRRGVLEVTRAISTTPYAGDISFNAKSGEKGRTSLYGTEMHATRFQYGFALTPERLRVQNRCLAALDGIINLGEVGGNHGRFLFDFSPESLVLRVTPDPAPRILYCFQEENSQVTVPELVRKVNSGDIRPEELFIGGPIGQHPEIKGLAGIKCFPGVKKALEACKAVISQTLSLGHG